MGRSVALALATAGCKVIGVARDEAKLRELAPLLDGAVYPIDLTIETQRERLIRSVTDNFGVPDIIVHVAGGSAGIRDPLLPSSEWEKVWRLNLGCAHDINRVFLPQMQEKRWGRIVHFSSNGVRLATGNVPYISSKGAVESYVRNLSRIYAPHGVVISAVSPGPIHTPGIFIYDQDEAWTKAFWEKYVPMQRWGQPHEVGNVAAFLCSEHASYMAGAIVPVDGGMR
jgi:NAD(P)-dependent dehydrogenase (short-subunit alcohol dehydrogenase family)